MSLNKFINENINQDLRPFLNLGWELVKFLFKKIFIIFLLPLLTCKSRETRSIEGERGGQIHQSFALLNYDHDFHLNFVFFLGSHTLLYINTHIKCKMKCFWIILVTMFVSEATNCGYIYRFSIIK